MKKLVLIAFIASVCFTASACSGQSSDVSVTSGDATTAQTTAQTTAEATTEAVMDTEKPTEIETEPEKIEYTGADLAGKSLSEIIEIMGGDYDVDDGQKHLIYYTSGPARNIYNDETLPGFVFFLEPSDGVQYSELADPADFDGVKSDISAGKLEIKFIGLFDGAKYDENISVGMKYLDISEAMGSYSLNPPVGSEAMVQSIKYADKETPKATVYYNSTGNDEEKARQENPDSWGIVVFPDK